MDNLIPIERIEKKIYLIRGQKVMLDRDLAEFYRIGTRALNQAVTRNLVRFPSDFMFQLTKEEHQNLLAHFGNSNLKSQFVTSSWGGRRKLPRVFTEQGVAMLSAVLHSEQAINISILIIRAFVRLRRILASNKELAQRVADLEKQTSRHEIEITSVFKLLKKMAAAPKKPRRQIGFLRDRE